MVMLAIGVLFVTNSHGYCDIGEKQIGRGYIVLETNHTDLRELNSAFRKKGYSSLPETIYGIGAGGYSSYKCGILWEGYASVLVPRSRNSTIGDARYTTSLNGTYGVYNIGYPVWSKNGLTIFPLAGIGIGGLWLRIKDREKRPFDDILENPLESMKETTIETKGIFIFNFAIGIEKSFRHREEKTKDRLLMAGIRLGYRYCPGDHEWSDISGGPDTSFTGPYCLFLFGGGYSRK